MFLTLCSHYTVPPWWKQSFHPCFECALHSKTDRFNCTHSYSARQCSDPCISEQSSALMNEASYCMYNIQHFISFRSSIATSKNLLSPARDRSRNSRIDPIRSRVSKPLDQPARFFGTVYFGTECFSTQYFGTKYFGTQYFGTEYLGTQLFGIRTFSTQYYGTYTFGTQYFGTQHKLAPLHTSNTA